MIISLTMTLLTVIISLQNKKNASSYFVLESHCNFKKHSKYYSLMYKLVYIHDAQILWSSTVNKQIIMMLKWCHACYSLQLVSLLLKKTPSLIQWWLLSMEEGREAILNNVLLFRDLCFVNLFQSVWNGMGRGQGVVRIWPQSLLRCSTDKKLHSSRVPPYRTRTPNGYTLHVVKM